MIGRLGRAGERDDGAVPLLGEFGALRQVLCDHRIDRAVDRAGGRGRRPPPARDDPHRQVPRGADERRPNLLEAVGAAYEFDAIEGSILLGLRRHGLSRSSAFLRALLRPRRGGRPRPPAGAAPGDDRGGDQARLARPGDLPPAPRRPRRPGLRDLQVPHHDRRRRRPAGGSSPTATKRAAASSRSRTTRGSPGSAASCGAPRSTSWPSSATWCAARFAGRAAPPGGRRGQPDRGNRAPPPAAAARRHRALADPRLGRIPLDEMVKIDYLYGANWSLWLDLKILLRTVPFAVARRGLLSPAPQVGARVRRCVRHEPLPRLRGGARLRLPTAADAADRGGADRGPDDRGATGHPRAGAGRAGGAPSSCTKRRSTGAAKCGSSEAPPANT